MWVVDNRINKQRGKGEKDGVLGGKYLCIFLYFVGSFLLKEIHCCKKSNIVTSVLINGNFVIKTSSASRLIKIFCPVCRPRTSFNPFKGFFKSYLFYEGGKKNKKQINFQIYILCVNLKNNGHKPSFVCQQQVNFLAIQRYCNC